MYDVLFAGYKCIYLRNGQKTQSNQRGQSFYDWFFCYGQGVAGVIQHSQKGTISSLDYISINMIYSMYLLYLQIQYCILKKCVVDVLVMSMPFLSVEPQRVPNGAWSDRWARTLDSCCKWTGIYTCLYIQLV